MRTLSRLRLPSTQGKQELLPRSIPLCNVNTSPAFLFNYPFKQPFVCLAKRLHFSTAERHFPSSISPLFVFPFCRFSFATVRFSPYFVNPLSIDKPHYQPQTEHA